MSSDPIRPESDPNPISPGNPERARARSKPRAETPAFVAFYELFPRKKKRDDAFKAWRQKGCEEIAGDVMAGLRAQLPELTSREPDKVPYPASYLRGGEWKDAPQPLRAVPSPKPADPYCTFHHQPRTRGKLPASGPAFGCPECKHAQAANGSRSGEPIALGGIR